MRTDGVYCRESAGTGSVNLKVVPKRVLRWQVTMDQLIYASLSHTHYCYKVGMLKVPANYKASTICNAATFPVTISTVMLQRIQTTNREDCLVFFSCH